MARFSHRRSSAAHSARSGFTLVELLIVVGLLTLLLAILVPSLFAARGASVRADSMNRLRNIAQWSALYASDSRQRLLPAVFDYTGSSSTLRTNASAEGLAPQIGTWTDILWAQYAETAFPRLLTEAPGHDYSLDSPDDAMHDVSPDYDDNPFRSAEQNTQGPNQSKPGYFAQNLFFDSRRNSNDNWYTMAQIRSPERSLQIIDSFGGTSPADSIDRETIMDAPGPWALDIGGLVDQKVDFRYAGEALVLLLDGAVTGQSVLNDEPPATGLDVLETDRKIKVRDLTR